MSEVLKEKRAVRELLTIDWKSLWTSALNGCDNFRSCTL